jgi:hypothetical protein
MNMKTRILLLITVLTAAAFNAVGQGYFLFTANKNSVWDDFTAAPQSGGGHTIAGFLWGPAATVGLLGIGTGITNPYPYPALNPWSAILTDPQFHIGVNTNTSTTASVLVNPSGLAIGGINYNSSGTFPVLGTVGGSIYTVYCFAWDSQYATPQQAAAAFSPVGWSNPFQYTSGATAATPIVGFSTSGMLPFGVGIPEPATSALAGLSVAVLLLRHRTRSKFLNRSRPFDS